MEEALGIFTNFWHGMVNAVQSATAGLVIVAGIAAIIVTVAFTMFGLKKGHTELKIVISTVLSCILMIPVISSFDNLVKIKVETAIIDEGSAEIRALRADAARLLAQNEAWNLQLEILRQRISTGRQSTEMQTLNDSIKLLEHAQYSVQSFQSILELALLETNMKQTMVRKERIGNVQQNGQYDEILAIITHDITAKFGIDLNEVKVAKLYGTTVVVSGIQSKFIATPRNIAETFLSEIRRVDGRGGVDTVRVLLDSANINLANQYAENYKADFQRGLSNGSELGFMNDAVVQLAQNFILVMLAPLYGNNIRFDNAQRPDALPIMEYLERELRESNIQIAELTEAAGSLVQANGQPESEGETGGLVEEGNDI
jgi:regulator of replication initiation timing